MMENVKRRLLRLLTSRKVSVILISSVFTVVAVLLIFIWFLSPYREYEQMAKEYLIDKGYKIVSHENTSSYHFTKDSDYFTKIDFNKMGFRYDYFYKNDIVKVRYRIKNHPLDNCVIRNKDGKITWKGEGKTVVKIYIVDGKIIGGVSSPYHKESWVGGGTCKLDGSNWPGLK